MRTPPSGFTAISLTTLYSLSFQPLAASHVATQGLPPVASTGQANPQRGAARYRQSGRRRGDIESTEGHTGGRDCVARAPWPAVISMSTFSSARCKSTVQKFAITRRSKLTEPAGERPHSLIGRLIREKVATTRPNVYRSSVPYACARAFLIFAISTWSRSQTAASPRPSSPKCTRSPSTTAVTSSPSRKGRWQNSTSKDSEPTQIVRFQRSAPDTRLLPFDGGGRLR